MTKTLIITIPFLAILAILASPSTEDFAQCEKHHSRATCEHSLLP